MSDLHLAHDVRTVSMPRRLGGGEAAVIMTVLVLAGVLALTGRPVIDILQLLAGAGLLAVALVTVAGASPLHGLGRAARALLSSGVQR
ncbi:hypothetical protein [Streptomyces sp. Ag109_O5-10]|uniref:hypothetical protein n=1 Tax=Streptomyces sp. Ag109_O5-10 TaxID=1855349 RepID=UPI000896B96A|nr:hypothetical protein [Streptomyces sp. Ag109_O5-10]SEF19033.1 hypothetical protein SAMN05216533_8581 [Streptomyces sp. Ag109_O5-10]